MGKTVVAQPERRVVIVTQFLLVCCFVAFGLCCLEDIHPGKCTCVPFGHTRIRVTCTGVTQVPRDLPSNTAHLNLSGNHLMSIEEDAFRNLTLLKAIDLSRNNLKSIPQNCFRNLKLLTYINLAKNSLSGGFYLPGNASRVEIQENRISLNDLKIILKMSKDINYLNISENPIGPNLTSATFAGFQKMVYLYMIRCGLRQIESGSFRAMNKLQEIDLSNNMLSHIEPGTFEGPSESLLSLYLYSNDLTTIANGTFRRFSRLADLRLSHNRLTTLPDLTGPKEMTNIFLKYNQIRDVSLLSHSSINQVIKISLIKNQIEELPVNIFQKIPVSFSLDLSINRLTSIPDSAFSACKDLMQLILSFNSISQIGNRTFAGLKNLRMLMIIKNNLSIIPEDTFVGSPLLELLCLHGNRIKHIDGNAFRGLRSLQTSTLFDNPLQLLPVKIFDEMASNATLAISCKNLQKLPPGIYTAFMVCTPSAAFHISLYDDQSSYADGLLNSGFICTKCGTIPKYHDRCSDCRFCMPGTYSNRDASCLKCPAGGFYQDEMGQVDCKNCSTGTYVPETDHPGRSATDCRACPYGTRSNETAGYRACSCLHNFYRLDRFGPCSACPDYGLTCKNDTAILAPNYFWKWSSDTTMENYTKFVDNIYTLGTEYNKNFSIFHGPLPKPLKCPYPGSCNGGIGSTCEIGYEGTLCATCSYNHYLRFNRCLECPGITATVISCVLVIVLFVLLFVMIFLGDSTRTGNDGTRTVADVIMSCSKIVIGFYQVVSGIFSALVGVQWPVILISMEKCLKFVEGNILQFAPLSCINPFLRLDPFIQFAFAIAINILVVFLILLYLFLKKRHINKMEIFMSEKIKKISSLYKSCYRNILLFLLLSYPITSKKIIDILPLPGNCVTFCFDKDGNECISLLKADYSIRCFTTRHKIFRLIAAVFALYPAFFPLLLLYPIKKYRKVKCDPEKAEMAFGLRVFFENYKEDYWFWEIVEMYRKLLLISCILLFESGSHDQIYFTVIAASVSGITYTIFRPLKSKFEDRLQTFALWIIFFNVCLGAMYSLSDVSGNHGEDNSMFINVVFVVLNGAVLIWSIAKGLIYVRKNWRSLSSSVVRCFHLICRRCLKDRHGENNYLLIQPTEEEPSFEY